MSAPDDNRPVRPERFVSEEGEFVILTGPNRGQVLGAPPDTPLTPGQQALLDANPEPEAKTKVKPERAARKPATTRSPRRVAPGRAMLDDRELEELARQYAKAAEPPPQSSKQHSTKPRQRS